MRILHVTPCYGDAPHYGGLPRVVRDLAETQARLGHEVTVATTDAWEIGRRAPAGAFPPATGAPHVHLFRNLSNRLASAWQAYLPLGMRGRLRALVRGMDVVHAHAHRNLPEVFASAAAVRAGVPFVLSPHGTFGRIESKLAAKRAFDLACGHRAWRRARIVVALSEIERGDLVRLGVPTERIRVVPNGLFPSSVAAGDGARFRSKLGIPEGAPLLLFIGRIAWVKGLDVAVSVLARVSRKDTVLVVAGNDFGLLGDLKRLAARLGVADRVLFPGYLDEPAKQDALAAATLLLCPSRHDSFPIAAFEGISAAVPLLLSANVGGGELLREIDGVHIVGTLDPADWAAAIDRILDEPEKARERARRAARGVVETLAWDRVARRMIEVYEEVRSGS